MMNKFILLIATLFAVAGCNKNEDDNYTSFSDFTVPVSNTHSLKGKVFQGNNSKYLLVFESGLGDGFSVWSEKKVAEETAKKNDVLMYDRAGYGQSSIDSNPRNIERLRLELETVINQNANGRKVILVAHSLGGIVTRDFAIKNPLKTAALLFVDPSHENYNQPTQLQEDEIYNAFLSSGGANFGGTREARELREDMAYAGTLGNLPDIPAIVITSMKKDANNNAADQANNKTRQDWYNAHESLKIGLKDFTHIQTTNSGHYMMREEPDLVLVNLNLLISKLP
jgi:pimeloyl-ACP methyl ester carboxylesterase